MLHYFYTWSFNAVENSEFYILGNIEKHTKCNIHFSVPFDF